MLVFSFYIYYFIKMPNLFFPVKGHSQELECEPIKAFSAPLNITKIYVTNYNVLNLKQKEKNLKFSQIVTGRCNNHKSINL